MAERGAAPGRVEAAAVDADHAAAAVADTGAGWDDDAAVAFASLRAAASSSQQETRASLRAAGVPGAGRVRCAFLGQRSPSQAQAYEPHPAQWTVERGARRSHTQVAFRWWLPSGEEREHILRADSAIQRGVQAPWFDDVLLEHRLQRAAEEK